MDSHIWEVILRFMSASFLGVKVLLLMLCCLRHLETAKGPNFEHFKLSARLLREDSFEKSQMFSGIPHGELSGFFHSHVKKTPKNAGICPTAVNS